MLPHPFLPEPNDKNVQCYFYGGCSCNCIGPYVAGNTLDVVIIWWQGTYAIPRSAYKYYIIYDLVYQHS